MDTTELTRGQLALLRAEAPDDAVRAMRGVRDEGPVELARRFLFEDPEDARFLVLLGKKGTGKTVAATLVLSEVLRRIDAQSKPSGGESRRAQKPGMFVRANTLARLSAYDREDKDWFEELVRTSCLVIDDLGSEAATEIFKAQLYELLDRRYSRSRRTVITSNLDKPAFAARYGDRIADRLRERGMAEEFDGPSMRQKFEPSDG